MTLYVASIVFGCHYNLPVPLGNQGCLQFMLLAPKLLLFISPWCQSLCFNHFMQAVEWEAFETPEPGFFYKYLILYQMVSS